MLGYDYFCAAQAGRLCHYLKMPQPEPPNPGPGLGSSGCKLQGTASKGGLPVSFFIHSRLPQADAPVNLRSLFADNSGDLIWNYDPKLLSNRGTRKRFFLPGRPSAINLEVYNTPQSEKMGKIFVSA
jgi:hypothetical protein